MSHGKDSSNDGVRIGSTEDAAEPEDSLMESRVRDRSRKARPILKREDLSPKLLNSKQSLNSLEKRSNGRDGSRGLLISDLTSKSLTLEKQLSQDQL